MGRRLARCGRRVSILGTVVGSRNFTGAYDVPRTTFIYPRSEPYDSGVTTVSFLFRFFVVFASLAISGFSRRFARFRPVTTAIACRRFALYSSDCNGYYMPTRAVGLRAVAGRHSLSAIASLSKEKPNCFRFTLSNGLFARLFGGDLTRSRQQGRPLAGTSKGR